MGDIESEQPTTLLTSTYLPWQQQEKKPMCRPKLGPGNKPSRPKHTDRTVRQNSSAISYARLLRFLQQFVVVMLLPCVAILVVACGPNATTNQLPPVITSTAQAHPSPTPALSEVPSARKGGSMAYDNQMGMDLLFGGAAGPPQGRLNDTWAWNGHTWLPLHPVTSPLPRDSASMVYDAATGTIVLFGGISDSGTVLDDTWSWDGSSWTQLHPTTSPQARDAAGMAYDAAHQVVVLFGGETEQGRLSPSLNDTWSWDGSIWTQLHPATSPSARFGASMAYDAATQQVVLFGGGAGYPLNDTWSWDGITWTQLHPATSPPARVHASMVYDAASQQLVLFGGEAGSNQLSDTWTWDGSTWTEQPPMPSPAGGFNSATYDAANQYVLALATTGEKANVQAETWTWTGTTWKKLD